MFTSTSTLIVLSLTSLGLVSAAQPKQRLSCTSSAQSAFPPLDYNTVQISGGVAGNALAQATALCVTPFAGLNLAEVTSDELKNLNNFFRAAEDTELNFFNPQLAKATGANKVALQHGKTKNKVLKLVCDIQVAKIKIAQNNPQHDVVAVEEKKLAHNVALDVAAAGQVSRGV